MRDITILVTASGAPGTAALLRALRMNGERGVRVVGTDMSPQAVGRHFCDRFYVVPPGSDPGFPDAVLDIVRRENVDVVLPQSSFDLLALAETRERFMGTTVMVSPPEAIRAANDKAEAYALL
jgi:carbamoylphosphate synthase large subunit